MSTRRGPLPQDMADIATHLKYHSEKEMLHRMYITDGLTISQISGTLGYSPSFIRRRLLVFDIARRSVGGNQVRNKEIAQQLKAWKERNTHL